jgi:hypothetical protein
MLRKVSLNALKARKMALSAGIVPKTGTSWKSALRNVRDSRGNLKSGKDMAKAKEKMGLLPNNEKQALSAAQKKHQNVEIGYTGKGLNGKNDDKLVVGSSRNLPMGVSEGEKYSLHTHPQVSSSKLRAKINKRNPELARVFKGEASSAGSMDNTMFSGILQDRHVKHRIYAPDEGTMNVYTKSKIKTKEGKEDRIWQHEGAAKEAKKIAKKRADENKISSTIKRVLTRKNRETARDGSYEGDKLTGKLLRGSDGLKLNARKFIVDKNKTKFNLNGEPAK